LRKGSRPIAVSDEHCVSELKTIGKASLTSSGVKRSVGTTLEEKSS
jgi:hypothetical protein